MRLVNFVALTSVRCWPLFCWLVVGPILTAEAQELATEGDQFQVNTYTPNGQNYPTVAMNQDGSFVIVWHSEGSDNGDPLGYSIQGQRFDSDGTRIGDEFLVNSYTTGSQRRPKIANDAAGNFVVIWREPELQGRLFDSDGTARGSQFQINTYTTGIQILPVVAMGRLGNFIVTWDSLGSDGDDSDGASIQARLFDADGTPVTDQFQVNEYTTGFQSDSAIAATEDGDFVITWDSPGSFGDDSDDDSIQARRFDANGAPLGGQFQVNTFTTDFQSRSAVAITAEGGFIVVWQSSGPEPGDPAVGSVQGQRFASDGIPIGGQFLINSYTPGRQDRPTIVSSAEGKFVVAWASNNAYTSSTQESQLFAADGSRIGGELQLNTDTADAGATSFIAADGSGNFVVVWGNFGAPGNDPDISAQGRRVCDCGIFADGFESGGTNAWSQTLTDN